MTTTNNHDHNLSFHEAVEDQTSFLIGSLSHIDTLLLDISAPNALLISNAAKSRNCNTVPFRLEYGNDNGSLLTACNGGYGFEKEPKVLTQLSGSFFEKFIRGETRVVFGPKLSKLCNSDQVLSYRIVVRGKTLHPSSELPLRKRKILHVMGSTASNFYDGLSTYCGFNSINYLPDNGRFNHIVGYIHRDGSWSIGTDSPNREYITEDAPRLTFAEAMATIASLKVDAVLPHMFDYVGLTAYRAVFDILRIPIMGCSAETMALSINKMRTVAVAEKAGVPVPESQAVRKNDRITLEPPLVVKPTEEDNSHGISLVRNKEQLELALEKAFEMGDEVLVERFIPLGKELRVAVLENPNGEFFMLPCAEYMLPAEKPIRTPQDKLTTDSKSGRAEAPVKVDRQIPAQLSSELKDRLKDAALKAHHALGCRDYGIYDFRVDPNDKPFMLESCLYCSFATTSILAIMWEATGSSTSNLFEMCVEWAIARRATKPKGIQRTGMKAKS